MKYLLKVALFFSYFLVPSQSINDLYFGTENTFEVMTWNIESFPKNGQTTIDYTSQIIEALDVDFIAIQEINNETNFNQLKTDLTNYSGFIESTDYDGLAFLYKANTIQINYVYRIFETSDYWNTFPRAPMVIDITYNNQQLFIINNHLKCCGDGYLDSGNTADEEYRRYQALSLLKSYIDTNLANENVILLGDLNDSLSDRENNNVFQNLIDDSSNYFFTDYNIANGTNTEWSYPSWPSHLDHILITNELFDEFQLPSATIETIKIDNYLSGGFSEYDENVSDHRPVALKLTIDSNLGIDNVVKNESVNLTNYPNPFNYETTFSFKNTTGNVEILIYNTLGQMVYTSPIINGQTKFKWKSKNLSNGIYYAKLVLDKKEIATRKILVSSN